MFEEIANARDLSIHTGGRKPKVIVPHTRDDCILMIPKLAKRTTKLSEKADEGSLGRHTLVNQYQFLRIKRQSLI